MSNYLDFTGCDIDLQWFQQRHKIHKQALILQRSWVMQDTCCSKTLTSYRQDGRSDHLTVSLAQGKKKIPVVDLKRRAYSLKSCNSRAQQVAHFSVRLTTRGLFYIAQVNTTYYRLILSSEMQHSIKREPRSAKHIPRSGNSVSVD